MVLNTSFLFIQLQKRVHIKSRIQSLNLLSLSLLLRLSLLNSRNLSRSSRSSSSSSSRLLPKVLRLRLLRHTLLPSTNHTSRTTLHNIIRRIRRQRRRAHKLILIERAVLPVTQDRQEETGDGCADPRPDEVGIVEDWGEGFAESGGQSGGEEEEGHDETFHGFRGARVRQFVGGDVAEDFGESAQYPHGGLDPDVQGGDAGADCAV